MIKFKYNLPENLVPLVRKAIVDYPYDYLVGYMEKNIAGQLRHASLYMICELEVHNGVAIHKNPLGIVARNDMDAMSLFANITHKENGTVLCEVVNRCDDITVEPL